MLTVVKMAVFPVKCSPGMVVVVLGSGTGFVFLAVKLCLPNSSSGEPF